MYGDDFDLVLFEFFVYVVYVDFDCGVVEIVVEVCEVIL